MKTLRDLEPREPFTFELLDGVSVTVRPRTGYDLEVAKAAAQRRLDALDESQEACIEAGLLRRGKTLSPEEEEDRKSALYHLFVIDELAVRHITAWTGVEGFPEPAPEAVRAVMAIWPDGALMSLGEKFYRKFMEGARALASAKKESGAGAAGTSSQAAAPITARDAGKTTSPAPTASAA